MTPTLARKKSQFLEDQIQMALIQHIELRKVPGLVYFHVPNSSKLGGARTRSGVPLAAIRAKRLGLLAGVSDLVFLHQGVFYSLELKSAGGKPSKEQLEFMADVTAAGGEARWASNIDDALQVLTGWGLLR